MNLVTEPPGDTTADPKWVSVQVTARLTSAVVHADTYPLHLDGPLSWGAYQAHINTHGHGSLPPMDPNTPPADFDLPLATWTRNGHWGWACSRAQYDPIGYTTLAMRRRPAAEEMARYSPDAKHHLSAGPMKARDTPLAATLIDTISWWALADPAQLETLLNQVPGIGRLPRHGNGRVLTWAITGHDDQEAWKNRVMPDPTGTVQAIRAPYHHQSRETLAC